MATHPLSGRPVRRRSVLTGAAALVGGSLAGALTGCSSTTEQTPTGTSTSGSASGSAAGTMRFGSNQSDPDSRAAFRTLMDSASKDTGVQITINNSDHESFQNNISNYLQGTPDDAFPWFAGYRMQYLAAQGLAAPIDDVWEKIGSHFDAGQQKLAKGADGRFYFVPFYTYPWVMFYSKKVFDDNGYEVPTTWDALLALAQKVKADGLVPIAVGNKEGWPALGTFDILNMRLNGYDYHLKLLAHEVPWTDPGVHDVFSHWAELAPYLQTAANGRSWEDAVRTLQGRKAAMMFQGTAQVPPSYDKANLDDLGFFVYPQIDSAHGTDGIDAPTDGFMLAAKAKNPDAAKKVLAYLGQPQVQADYMKSEPWEVGAAKDTPQGGYNDIQRRSAELLAGSQSVARFFDTDTDPAMASAMVKLIQGFLNDPSEGAISALQQSAESQAKSIFA